MNQEQSKLIIALHKMLTDGNPNVTEDKLCTLIAAARLDRDELYAKGLPTDDMDEYIDELQQVIMHYETILFQNEDI